MVNVSSIGAVMPMHGTFVSYAVAKAAQDALTNNLAFEFAPKGVRINSVLPGMHRYDFSRLSHCL